MQTVELEVQPELTKTEPGVKQICDGCGGTVPASYQAVKNDYVLNFCGHHIRKYADKLINDGFAITPEDISYNASNFSYEQPI